MPHVIVKVWPGKSEDQKARLADQITRDVADILSYGEDSISVAIEDVSSHDWAEQVYRPDIRDRRDELYKKPGYEM
jgi:4-oxalocrotonate tautomerase